MVQGEEGLVSRKPAIAPSALSTVAFSRARLNNPERHTIFVAFDHSTQAVKRPVPVYALERLEKLSEN